MSVRTERFVVIESEPVTGVGGGVLPETRYFETAIAARTYAQSRIPYFGRIDIASVLARIRVTYVPQISEEGGDDPKP